MDAEKSELGVGAVHEAAEPRNVRTDVRNVRRADSRQVLHRELQEATGYKGFVLQSSFGGKVSRTIGAAKIAKTAFEIVLGQTRGIRVVAQHIKLEKILLRHRWRSALSPLEKVHRPNRIHLHFEEQVTQPVLDVALGFDSHAERDSLGASPLAVHLLDDLSVPEGR